MNPALHHDELARATWRGYAGFDSPPPPSTPNGRSNITDENVEQVGAEVIVVTAQTLQDAEAELLAEYRLRGEPMPEHEVRQDADTPCDYCTLVAQRAATMVMDRADKQN